MSVHRRRTPDLARRSQHFLRRDLAADLVARSSISARDLVVEIGAGRGVLTREIARRCRLLIAVEIDPALGRGLEDSFAESPTVRVVEGDFLNEPLPREDYKVFGNVPFHRTAEIIRKLTGSPSPPAEAYLVLQQEAAARFAGWPAGRESRQSLMLKPWWHVEVIRRLARTDFSPPPQVDSAVLWLARRERPLICRAEEELYRRMVGEAFGSRGRTVAARLEAMLTRQQIRRLAVDLDFDARARPSDMAFDQWLGVFRFYALQKRRASAG